MFQHILVPLDGSTRAEQALPTAARIARASGGSVILLRVASAAIDFAWSALESPLLMQETIDADRAKAVHYLAEIAQSSELAGIPVQTEVLTGAPAPTILSVAYSRHTDLIVMCSHGDTGFKRLTLGSVTQKVLRQSSVPVLVLYEDGGVPTNLHPEGTRSVRILVALDGSPLAEAVLVPAAQLSVMLSAPAQGALHLAHVLRLPQIESWEPFVEAKKQAISDAQAYLSHVEQRLNSGDLASLNLLVTSSIAFNKHVAETLMGIAEIGETMEDVETFTGCDIIAMATHGRSGPERWVMGSVTERVLGATRLPLLIVRPPKTVIKPEQTTGTNEPKVIETAAEIPTWAALF